MDCGCKTTTTKLLLEGEYGADPVWCAVCQYNIELDELPIDDSLMNELLQWGNSYGQWVDLEVGQFVAGGEEMQATHNQAGALLAKKLQMALAGVTVTFHASEM